MISFKDCEFRVLGIGEVMLRLSPVGKERISHSETFEKKAYKSIILNYNSYAVRVTYNGTLYTVPSGGYVVINYDNWEEGNALWQMM